MSLLGATVNVTKSEQNTTGARSSFTPAGMLKLTNPVKPKAAKPRVCKDAGSVTVTSLGQLEKANSPIVISLELCVNKTLVRFIPPAKAPPPMVVTLSGMVMLVSPVQLLKAYSPMVITLSGMTILVKLSQ